MADQSFERNQEKLLRLYDRVVDRIYGNLIDYAGPKEGNRIITDTRSELRNLAPYFPDLSLLHPWRLPLIADAFHLAFSKTMQKRKYSDCEYKELLHKLHTWFITSFSPLTVRLMLKFFCSRLFQWYLRISFKRTKKIIRHWAAPVSIEGETPFHSLGSCLTRHFHKSDSRQTLPHPCFLDYYTAYLTGQTRRQEQSKMTGVEKAKL